MDIVCLMYSASRLFDSFLRLPPPIEEALVLGKRLQQLQAVQILVPACADGLVDQSGKLRIGEHQPAARRNAVGLVAETFRESLVVVAQGGLFPVAPCAARQRH